MSFFFLTLAAFAQQATGQITKITDERRSMVSNSTIEIEGKSKSIEGFFDNWQNKEHRSTDSLYESLKCHQMLQSRVYGGTG